MYNKNKDLLAKADKISQITTKELTDALRAVKELAEMVENDELLNDTDLEILDKGVADINMLLEYRRQKLN